MRKAIAILILALAASIPAGAQSFGQAWFYGGASGGGGSGTTTNQVKYGISANASGTAAAVDSVVCTPPSVNGQYTVGYTVTGGVALASSCPLVGLAPRGVAGATDTVLYSDVNNITIYTDNSGTALAGPTPTSLVNANAFTVEKNHSTGVVTFTPTTWTVSLSGATAGATATIQPQQTCSLFVDPITSTQWDLDCADAAGYVNGAAVGASLTGVATNSSKQLVQQTSANILSICTTCVTSAASLTVNQPVVGGGSQASVALATTFSSLTTTCTSGQTWAIASAWVANASITITGSCTLNLTNPLAGGNYVLVVTQGSGGSHTLALGTGCTWKVSGGGGGTITPTTTAAAIDVLAFTYDGTNCYANYNKNFN